MNFNLMSTKREVKKLISLRNLTKTLKRKKVNSSLLLEKTRVPKRKNLALLKTS